MDIYFNAIITSMCLRAPPCQFCLAPLLTRIKMSLLSFCSYWTKLLPPSLPPLPPTALSPPGAALHTRRDAPSDTSGALRPSAGSPSSSFPVPATRLSLPALLFLLRLLQEPRVRALLPHLNPPPPTPTTPGGGPGAVEGGIRT